MEGYTERTFGEEWAAEYDALHADLDPRAAVETLAELADGKPVLELGIGTGRVALPLRERGVDVHGVEVSEAMVAQLRKKPGGAEIPITIGSFAEVDVGARFTLIFLVFNTIFAPLTQEEQARVFENAARHLTDDGVFLVEAFVPDLSRYDRNQRVSVMKVELDSVQLELARHDRAKQQLEVQIATFGPHGTRMRPIRMRYAYPSELDLMAQLAGLRVRERWGSWGRDEFGSDSQQHVSLYERT